MLVPHRPGSGGTVDSSTDEVAAVIDLIREHARTRPHESLGVIAMGITHADRIAEALRIARGEDPALDAAACLDDAPGRRPLLREEPRAGPRRRARRHHPDDRLPEDARRTDAVSVRAAQSGRRRTAPQRRHHSRAEPHPGRELVRARGHGRRSPSCRRCAHAEALPRVRTLGRNRARTGTRCPSPSSTGSSRTSRLASYPRASPSSPSTASPATGSISPRSTRRSPAG